MHVVVIGNGVAGVTAARRLRRKQPGWAITIISGESDVHYSRPALMYVFMGHMRLRDARPIEPWRFAHERIVLKRAWVTGIDVDAKVVRLHDAAKVPYDKLLIATGSRPNRFGWPGQDLRGVQGFYDLLDLRQLYDNSAAARDAVIVGGGLIGIELAEMLHSRGIHVTFLVRETSYWSNVLPPQESAMINRVIREAGMALKLETELDAIIDDGTGRAGAVDTDRGERIACQLVGLTAGVHPNLSAVQGSSIETDRGVLVDPSFRTSVPDVYAAGDCAELVTPDRERNIVEQVWYTARAQGEVVADVLAGEERSYERGIWFNSAKFLDLEYQVYGTVPNVPKPEETLYWEHESHEHAVRLVHEAGKLVGLDTIGIRYRHQICERWIREQRPIAWVVDHLEEANFDPELFRRHEPEIIAALRAQVAA
jgi:NADPH-dependent 2,4-dienoyl-CoA reductase/sulfur reductase-like enzyme